METRGRKVYINEIKKSKTVGGIYIKKKKMGMNVMYVLNHIFSYKYSLLFGTLL